MDFKIIRVGYLKCDKGFVTVGRDMGKKVMIPVYSFLVRHPKANVLIDTGFSHDFKKTWGLRLKYFNPILEINIVDYVKEYLEKTKTEKIDKKDKINKIDYIINTHLHIDHSENNSRFKDAEIIVQEEEYCSAKNPKPYQKYAYADNFNEKLKYRLIQGNLDLFGDSLMQIIKTPGHTEGHQSVLLNVNGKDIFIAGDACYSSENLKYNCFPAILWNPDKIMEGYDLIRSLKNKNTTIIFGHGSV